MKYSIYLAICQPGIGTNIVLTTMQNNKRYFMPQFPQPANGDKR